MREVQSSIVEKCVTVIDVLARSPGALTYSEISEATGFNKSSTHRLLSILVGQDLVKLDEDSKSYTIGSRLIGWARASWQKIDLKLIEDRDLQRISAETGLNVALAVRIDNSATFIRTHVVHPFQLAVKIGGQSELFCTAVGKLFLAHMADDELDSYLDAVDLEKHTENTITNADDLRRDLVRIRKRGYAIGDREEFWQIVGIAAPVIDYDNRIVAAINVWSPTKLASMDEIKTRVPTLLRAAADLSKRFGSVI